MGIAGGFAPGARATVTTCLPRARSPRSKSTAKSSAPRRLVELVIWSMSIAISLLDPIALRAIVSRSNVESITEPLDRRSPLAGRETVGAAARLGHDFVPRNRCLTKYWDARHPWG